MSDALGRRPNPAALILAASVVSGATGYVVTWIVASIAGPADYSHFAVFWSALFLIVGSLAGVQQELARATSVREVGTPRTGALAMNFGLVVAAAVLVVLAATSALWIPAALPHAPALAAPLVLGATSYVLVATLVGSLYGIRMWTVLAAMIALDGVLRLIGVVVVLSLGGGVAEVGWAVSAPFVAAVVVTLPLVARRLATSATVDVGYRALTWNVARTVVAAASAATLISGFPLLLSVTSDVAPELLGPFILALTLTRAPIVIPLMSLQSYLIVEFGRLESGLGRRLFRLILLLLGAALVLAALGALVGPWAMVTFFGPAFAIEPLIAFVLVASSGLVGALCISGPAALARSLHGIFVGGWLVASVVTIAALLLPLEFEVRMCIALIAGPIVGLVTHAIGLSRVRAV